MLGQCRLYLPREDEPRNLENTNNLDPFNGTTNNERRLLRFGRISSKWLGFFPKKCSVPPDGNGIQLACKPFNPVWTYSVQST